MHKIYTKKGNMSVFKHSFEIKLISRNFFGDMFPSPKCWPTGHLVYQQ